MKYLKIKRRASSRVNVPNFLSGIDTARDQSILGLGSGVNCYNFDFTSGALKACKGFEDININADSVWACRFGERTVLMYCLGGEIFYKDADGEQKKLEGITLTGKPKAIGYRLFGEDVVLICSPTDKMVVWNGEDAPYYVNSSPLITSMTIHYERMFVTTSDEPNTLWFSDDLDPTNWNTELSEGGFIELADERGALVKALGFLNYVYIFRERGISRLTAYADQSEFSVSHLFVTSGKIYPETIALCGDKVFFASSDGLYSFDGVSATKILSNLDGFIKPDENSVAVYHGGKYYLALRADYGSDDGFASDYVNNTVLICGKDGYTVMRGYDVSDFYSSGDKLYAVIGGKLRVYGGECNYHKTWTTPQTDLGSGRIKKIKTLHLDTKTDIKLTVLLDENKKTFFVSGKGTTSRININMPCRKFGMIIESDDNNASISRPQLSFSFIDR